MPLIPADNDFAMWAVMLLMMGGGVFVIVMAILLPIINLNQLVG